MKVLKFGGTSVGTVASLTNVKKIVEGLDTPAVVVVSALGGITDMLIATARMAAEGCETDYKESFKKIVARHTQVIDGMTEGETREQVAADATAILNELERLYYGIYLVNDLSERVLDRVVSFGERLSSTIISRIIKGITLVDSRTFIKTVRRHGKNVLDNEATHGLVQELLAPLRDGLVLVPGFISTDSDGRITNLGRGGSDYTAAIIAAELDADVLDIWTDVDGFLTADPRRIAGTRIIDRMTFVEAMELCNFGAKVIYPPTIYPVFHKNIPIYIKNTFNYEAPGTRIDDGKTIENRGNVRGVSSLRDTSLVSIERPADTALRNQLHSRVYNALARKGIDTILSDLSTDIDTFSFAVSGRDAETVIEELELEFGPEIGKQVLRCPQCISNLATIALVEENMPSTQQVLDKARALLANNGIKVVAHSCGKSSSSVGIIVNGTDETAALQALHDLFFKNDGNE